MTSWPTGEDVTDSVVYLSYFYTVMLMDTPRSHQAAVPLGHLGNLHEWSVSTGQQHFLHSWSQHDILSSLRAQCITNGLRSD